MWTYLSIFLGITAIIIVFLRRMILVARGVITKHEEEEATPQRQAEEGVKKKRISRGDKTKIKELLDRAKRLINIGKEDEAIKCYIQALAVNENDLESLKSLAMLYMKKEMFSPAAAMFRHLAELEDDAMHYSHLGLALYQQNLLSEALTAYQESVVRDESRPQRFVSLAQVYWSMNNPAVSIVALNKGLALDPENVDMLVLKVHLLKDLKQYVDARKVVARVLDKDPENDDAKALLRKLRALSPAPRRGGRS